MALRETGVTSDFVSESRCWQCRCPFSQDGLSDLKRLAPAEYCMLAETFSWPPTPEAQVQEVSGYKALCHGSSFDRMSALQQHADKKRGLERKELVPVAQLIKMSEEVSDSEDEYGGVPVAPGRLEHAVLSEVLREATPSTAPQVRAPPFE